uniref:Otospiralin n=1 Tax=Pelusios castaneus TaxID=367368 RepID=A0A8C8RNP2_9SAUR
MFLTMLSFTLSLLCLLFPLHQGKGVGNPYQEPAILPYWPFWSSDFWSYVEYFQTLGAYNRINEMARTLFAQYPFGNTLDYEVPDHEH